MDIKSRLDQLKSDLDRFQIIKKIFQILMNMSRYQQSHVLNFLSDLTDVEKNNLLTELEEVDLAEMKSMWDNTCGGDVADRDLTNMEPVEDDLCESVNNSSSEALELYKETGKN